MFQYPLNSTSETLALRKAKKAQRKETIRKEENCPCYKSQASLSFIDLHQVQTLEEDPPNRPTDMLRKTWLCIILVAFVSHPVWLQKPPKRKTPAQLKAAVCCEEMRELKAQVANLSSLLGELSKKQESDWVSVVMQVMELESSSKRMESRLTVAEGKYSEMNNQIDIMQLQAAQTVTQTSAGKRCPQTLLTSSPLRVSWPQRCFWIACSTEQLRGPFGECFIFKAHLYSLGVSDVLQV